VFVVWSVCLLFPCPFSVLPLCFFAVSFFLSSSVVYSYALAPGNTRWTLIGGGGFTGTGSSNRYFGCSVSLAADGTTLAVGEYGANAVWIFTAAPVGSGSWAFQRTITQGEVGLSGGNFFGQAVALSTSGDTLVVGANYYLSAKGAAVVFVRSSGSWAVQSSLLADGSTSGQFGSAVAINGAGNRIAIAAQYDTTQATKGAVYIYIRSGTSWSYKQQVLPIDLVTTHFCYFGKSLALSSSGDTLVVGANGESSGQGGWRHFEWNGAQFNQIGRKKVGQPTSGNPYQGTSIALSADGQTVIGQ
jgi:hypothetical protein